MSSAARSILFFSRGRGRGHAIPDIEITRELRRISSDVEVLFASYATGAITLREAGFSVVDLGLGEDARYLQVLERAFAILREQQPSAVVAHEEFAALPAARALGLRAIFIVDFFPPVDLLVDSLGYADDILFIEQRGLFLEPPALRGKIRYLGPVVRNMAVSRHDRPRAREDLGLPPADKVIAVIPGAWATETKVPIVDLVLEAFTLLPYENRRLVWAAGRDAPSIAARTRGAGPVVVMGDCSPIERLMVASDLVVTKANRGTTIELASLGIPSISLSFGLNPIDEVITPRLRSNTALNARGIDAAFLAETMRAVIESPDEFVRPDPSYRPGAGAAKVARELAAIVAGR